MNEEDDQLSYMKRTFHWMLEDYILQHIPKYVQFDHVLKYCLKMD